MLIIAKAAFRRAAATPLLHSRLQPSIAARSRLHTAPAASDASVHHQHTSNCSCPEHAAAVQTLAAAAAPALSSSSTTNGLAAFPLSQPAALFAWNGMLVPHYGPSDVTIILPEHEIVDEIECAVPKKRHSVSRSRHRRAGDRLSKRRREYANYRVCFVCGTPVLQHHLCTKCMHIPTRA